MKSIRLLPLFSLPLLAFLALTHNAVAQSVTVLGTGGNARSCSVAAQSAAARRPASRDDIETCTRALEHENLNKRDRAATLVNRGILLAADESYQAALDDYNKAMTVLPELPEPYVGRGNLWFLAGRFDTAIDDYDKALDLMLGRSHLALYNRGLAHEKAGNQEQAIADYREALNQQPDFKQAQEKLDRLAAPSSAR